MSGLRRPLALDVDSAALLACEREPIRTPGGIQPRGALLVVDEPAMRVQYASENLEEYMGRPARELLGIELATLSSDRLDETVRSLLEDSASGRPARRRLASPAGARSVDVFAHRSGAHIVVELEDIAEHVAAASFDEFQDDVLDTLGRFQRAGDVADVLEAAVSLVHELTGFDRVLAYRFEPDGHGVVVNERHAPELEPFLGLHYPASDIPAQARALYRERWIRIIPDSAAAAIDLIGLPDLPPPTAIDLGAAVLRAVSPVHLQYLRNMGVQASMSVSLVVADELWGLIVCHGYREPRRVPYRVRAACEVLGLTASTAIAAKSELAVAERRVALEHVGARLIERVAGASSIAEGLLDEPELLLGVCDAAGVALRVGGALRLAGATPSEADVERIFQAIGPATDANGMFATDALASERPQLVDLAGVASGVLAMNLSRDGANAIVWFRPELVRTVTWAGDPQKAVEVSPDGTRWLGPRHSFAEWAEIVRGRARGWDAAELAAAGSLRSSLGSFLLERAEQLAALNAELGRANAELDAFAFMAAHDLKEPLLGIHRFAEFLREDHEAGLGADGLDKVARISRLSHRMQQLLDAMLGYARVGRAQLDLQELDVRAVVDEAMELLVLPLAASRATVEVHGSPSIVADRVWLREVFMNLISNAIKYTDRTEPRIDVRVRPLSELAETPLGLATADPSTPVLSVCDDGIGIAPEHADDVFAVFRRLHLRDAYGGGSGAGLTIVRRIVERHGGAIWIDSRPGAGSCFQLTLAPGGGADR